MVAKSVSRKSLLALVAIAMAFAMCLLWAAPKAYAASVSYVERSWNGTEVVSETKTTDAASLSNSTMQLDGWYVVDSFVLYATRPTVTGTANIILSDADGCTLYFMDGINVPEGATLNIYGQQEDKGRFYAFADTNGYAAIGGNGNQTMGTLNVHGGNVVGNAYNENKGNNAAGIGGGEGGNGGNFTMYGGSVIAYGANETLDGGAGIGGGKGGDGGSVRIYGGTVVSTGGPDGAGIGGGDVGTGGNVEIYGGKVEAIGGTDAAGIGGGQEGAGGVVTISGGEVKAETKESGAGIGGGEGRRGGTVNISGGIVHAKGGENGAGIGGGDYSGSLGYEGHAGEQGIEQSTSATVTISGGEVHASGGKNGAGIGGGYRDHGANLIIESGTVLAFGGEYAAGIGAGGDDGTGTHGGIVQIKGGKVEATAGNRGAGIGGGKKGNGPLVVRISGGEIRAEGKERGAGIGGGEGGYGAGVVISGGKVEAIGGEDAAGIGGGDGSHGGNVEISEDDGPCEVYAWGGDYGAGIGGGDGDAHTYDNDNGGGGSVTITGGHVEAYGGEDAAGIGGGEGGNGATVEISGGYVKAWGASSETGSQGGAGIGSGDYDIDTSQAVPSAGHVTITDGEVHARGGDGAAGIGGGNGVNGSYVRITGGDVSAQGGDYGAGIGGGDGYNNDLIDFFASDRGDAGEITITGDAKVTATGGEKAAGIGCGRFGETGTITIESGIVNAQGGPVGAGIGNGLNNAEVDDGQLTIIIKDGTVTATGGRTAAGIGGGSGGLSGAINIFGGTVNAQGGVNGGAGIGCGPNVENESGTVLINIEGGTVTARAGAMHGDEGTEYMPGTAIGVSGGENGASKFYGRIQLNGGEITAYTPLVGPTYAIQADTYATIGVGSRDNLTSGVVTFSGAHVTMYNELYRDDGRGNVTETTGTIVPSVVADQLTLVEECGDTHFHQCVRYKENGPQEDWTTALADERVKVLVEELDNRTFSVTEVKPCEHEGAEYTDNGDTHSIDCNACTHEGEEPHTYGDPVWTWADDYSWATATFTCKCKHEEKLTNNDIDAVTGEQQTDARGQVYAETTYIAKVTFNDKEYTDTKLVKRPEVTTPAPGAVTYDPNKTLADVELPEGWTWKDDTTVPTVGNSGYEASIAAYDEDYDYNDVDGYDSTTHTVTRTVPLTVNKAEVTVPEIEDKVYNAAKQTADVETSNLYTVTRNDGGTDVGEYDVVLTLKDASNYKWTDGEDAVKNLTFNIIPAKATSPETPSPGAMVYGPTKKLSDVALPAGWTWTNGTVTPTVNNEGYEASIPVDDKNYDYTGVEGYDPATHMVTRTVPLTVHKAEAAAPAIAPKKYNGANQKADVPGSDRYTVTKNEGGTEVGTYDVELTLVDPANYKWEDSDEAVKTLEFKILPIDANIVTVSIESWAYGDEPSAPVATAEFGLDTVVFSYAAKDSDTFSDAVPTQPGAYTVRASVAATANYSAGEATANFTVNPKVSFDANGGAGSKEPVAVKYGTEYTLPAADIFAAPAGQCGFDSWEVAVGSGASETKAPGDSIVMTDNATVKAIWGGHEWGEPTYVWSTGNKTVTATRICARDASHVESETVVAVPEVTREATEDEEGEMTYTGTFHNPAFEKQTKTEPIPIKEHVHDWGAPTYEWADDNSSVTATRTCKLNASHVETETVQTTSEVIEPATCEAMGTTAYTATFSNTAFATQMRTVADIPALGHDWGEWVVTKEATETEEGVETRTCKRDPAHTETRAIPKKGSGENPQPIATYAFVSGNGSSWTKGSSATADFTVKRSAEDSQTYSRFTGISVDGAAVAATNYTKEAGSVILKLNPAYLETLSTGAHTLTAQFDDGDASAEFTVRDSSASKPEPSNDDNGKTTPSRKSLPNTGDPFPLGAAVATAVIAAGVLVFVLRRRRSE